MIELRLKSGNTKRTLTNKQQCNPENSKKENSENNLKTVKELKGDLKTEKEARGHLAGWNEM